MGIVLIFLALIFVVLIFLVLITDKGVHPDSKPGRFLIFVKKAIFIHVLFQFYYNWGRFC